MAADILSSEMKSRLNLTTKTVGADRIRRAKENNEDIAVLSMFLPGSSAKEENSLFRCSLGYDCRLGDARLATPGSLNRDLKPINLCGNGQIKYGKKLFLTIIELVWMLELLLLISQTPDEIQRLCINLFLYYGTIHLFQV